MQVTIKPFVKGLDNSKWRSWGYFALELNKVAIDIISITIFVWYRGVMASKLRLDMIKY